MGERGAQDQAFAFPLNPNQVASSWHQCWPRRSSAHRRSGRWPAFLRQFPPADRRGSALIGDGGFDLGARTRQIRDDLLALPPETDVAPPMPSSWTTALFMTTWRDRALAVLDSAAVADHPDRAEFQASADRKLDGHATRRSVGYRLKRALALCAL